MRRRQCSKNAGVLPPCSDGPSSENPGPKFLEVGTKISEAPRCHSQRSGIGPMMPQVSFDIPASVARVRKHKRGTPSHAGEHRRASLTPRSFLEPSARRVLYNTEIGRTIPNCKHIHRTGWQAGQQYLSQCICEKEDDRKLTGTN